MAQCSKNRLPTSITLKQQARLQMLAPYEHEQDETWAEFSTLEVAVCTHVNIEQN
jgi:hypothetical protein